MGFFKKIFGSETNAEKEDPGTKGLDCLTALAMHLRGETDQALAVYRELAAESPEQRLPRFLGAAITAEQGDAAGAAAELRSLSAMIADSGGTISQAIQQELLAAVQEAFIAKGASAAAEMVAAFGNALKRAGFVRESAVCFEIAAALVPDNPHVLHELGDTLHDLRMYDYAEKVLRHALDQAPNHWGALYTYAVLLQDLGRNEEAIDCYEKAARLNPEHANCRNNYGAALFRVNRIDEALEQCTAAEGLAPESPFVKVNLGNIYLLMSDYAHSAECFREAIALNPNIAAAYFGMASAEKGLGSDEAKVRELYEKAVEIDPQLAQLFQPEGMAAGSPD